MKPEATETTAGKAVHVVADGDETSESSARSFDSPHERVKSHPRHRSSPALHETQPQHAYRNRTAALWAVVALIALSVSIFGYQMWPNKPATNTAAAALSPPPVVTVSTAVAKEQSVADTLTVTGSVSAWDPLSVGAEVGSLRITAVKVEEGDYVKKGEPLALLNSALLQAQLEQAEARLHSSQSSLIKSVKPNRDEEILALKAALAQAEATTVQEQALNQEAQENLDNAKLNADRYRQLAKAGASSIQEAETKQLAFDQAQQQLLNSDARIKAAHDAEDQARQKLLVATRGGRREDVDMSKAVIEETQGQIKQLREQIAETVIRAPDDGLISQRDAHIGDITTAGKTLFSIIRLNKLDLRAQVSDLDLQKFKPGQIVSISTKEDQSEQLQGKVWLVSPQVDQTSRLGIVRVQLPANAGLKPGMFVRGEVKLGHRQAVTVPVLAVVARNGQSFVFTLDGTRAVSREVGIGVQDEQVAEITSGLKAGEVVVVKGNRFLSDHDVVRVSQ